MRFVLHKLVCLAKSDNTWVTAAQDDAVGSNGTRRGSRTASARFGGRIWARLEKNDLLFISMILACVVVLVYGEVFLGYTLSPAIFSPTGTPLAADTTYSVFSPLRILDLFANTYDIGILLRIWIAGLFMALFLKELERDYRSQKLEENYELQGIR